jgi:hypothetical protein
MAKVILRFYEELNCYLPEQLRKRDFEFEFKEEATIQAIIESLGVPSEEVDLILAEGQSIGFDYVARTGERISIYPVFESINIAEVTCLPYRPLRSTKFVLDSDLEDLAAHMKRVGHDVRFDSCNSWSEIMKISEKERRIILTSNPALLRSKGVTHAILLPSTAPEIQLQGIMDRLEIHPREICLSS